MGNSVSATKEFVQDLLKQYPEKTAKRRAGHITVKETTTDGKGASDCSSCAVKSNVKSIPGVMTARGCAYAGSKGVVWGPIRDTGELLREVQRELNLTAVLVTHDAVEAASLADTVILCAAGRVIRQGTPGEVFAYSAGAVE